MGKNRGQWKKGERQGKGRQGKKGGYADIERANKAFEAYYKAQGIVPEGEWDKFMSILQVNLPATFRITGFKSHAQQLLRFLKSHYFKELVDVEVDGQAVEKPYPLPWFPDELAWQLNLSRGNIRKIPALEKLHSFLITETESGNISRQESVSMIPPLLLDVLPHHKVLDMCAAPGSKTGQLIEMLHADESQPWPEGFVMANDSDNKRCYIMVHQAKRLNSPCVMIVNNDATIMPAMQIPEKDTGQLKPLKFDRVLCDVPCSADGTLRKNYLVWKRWSVHNGFTLHPLQLLILTRGVEVLEIGGRLVYSTCSFNPIENEAVVGALLSRSQGAVELVDCSHELPNLKRISGVTTWKVMNENGKVYPNYDEVPEKNRKRIKKSMFPTDDVDNLHLERCIRLLPHHQDTGGFFIAVLQKVRGLPWTKESKQAKEAEKDSTEADGSAADEQEDRTERYRGPPRKKPRFEGYKEDPFIFFKESEELWPSMKEFYKVPDSFPHTQLLTRCETGKKRTVYLVNKAIKDIITNNHEKLKIINSGIRVWCRSDSNDVSCGFRLTQEGSASLFSYIENRKVYLTKQDVITLLTEENPFVHKMSTDARKQINAYGQGSIMFIYEPPESCPDENTIIVVGWRGKTSVRSFVSKGDRHHILRLCGVNITSSKKRDGKGKAEADQTDKNEEDDTEDNVEPGDDVSGDVESMEETDETIGDSKSDEQTKTEDDAMEESNTTIEDSKDADNKDKTEDDESKEDTNGTDGKL